MKRVDIITPPRSWCSDSLAISQIYNKMQLVGIPKSYLFREGVHCDYSILTFDPQEAERILKDIDGMHGFGAKEGSDLMDEPLDIRWSSPYWPKDDDSFDDLVLFREGNGMTSFRSLE